MEPFYLGVQAEEKPIVVTAADGAHKYTNAKIAKDHENFKSVIGKHYYATDKRGRKIAPKFNWAKVITPRFMTHHFTHPHPKAAGVSIKRKHVGGEAMYKVHVRVPHPTKEGKFIYNRHIWTKDPSKHLHRMLGEGRWSQENNKQFRKNLHKIVE
jgi:hypothetical protein